MEHLHVKILTPKGSFFEGDAKYINFYNKKDKIEILPGHISYMSEIVPSVLEIMQDGKLIRAAVSGGIVDFKENNVLILADNAEWPDKIDIERAREAYERAKKRIKSREPGIDKKRAESALQRALSRLKCTESDPG